jgi:hypothetical protein
MSVLNYCPYCKKNTIHKKPCRQITKQSEANAKKQATIENGQIKARVQERNRLETDINNFSQNYPLLWDSINDRLKRLEQIVQELEYRPPIE